VPGLVLWALVLSAAAWPVAGAEPNGRLPPDPVEELRQAIRLEQNKTTSDKTARQLALEFRKKNLDRAEKLIQTLGDLSRAILLIEWRTGTAFSGIEAIDARVRETLTQRFIADARKTITGGSTDQQVAVAGLVAATLNGLGELALYNAIVRELSSDLTRLVRTGSEPARAAAARALGQFAISDETAKERVFEGLRFALQPDQPVGVRQAAAEALLTLGQVMADHEPSRRSEPGISLADRQRSQLKPQPERRRELARGVGPLAIDALRDPDRNVRLTAALALLEVANSVVDLLKAAPTRARDTLPPKDREWSDEEYKEIEEAIRIINRFRDDYRPVVQAFNSNAAALGAAARDPDAEVRQTVLHVIEELGRARRLFVALESNIPTRPRRREIRAPLPAPRSPAAGLRLVGAREPVLEEPRPVELPPPAELILRQKDAPEDKKKDAPEDKKAEDKKAEGEKKDKNGKGDKDTATLLPLFARVARDLAADLKSPDLLTRRGAIIALDSLGEAAETQLEAILEATCDFDPIVRMVAARALGRFDKAAPRVVPALVKLLRDIDLDPRSAAANALGELGPVARDAVPTLATGVNRGDIEYRLLAMKALENIGEPAVPALPALAQALLDRSPRIRSEAARVLGRFGPRARAFAPALERLADDPDLEVRRIANEALLAVTRR
jgi:HEAT repeat protein